MDRLISAPDAHLSAVLVALCDDDRVQARALRYLAELQSYATRLAGSSGDPPPNAAPVGEPATNPLKRKALAPEPDQLEIQLCIQCKHAFTPTDNTSKACAYHDGELQADGNHDVWADWDEDIAGGIETPENQEDHPEGFSWSCCDKDGTRPGCTKGYHVAVRRNHFKRFQMYPPHEEDGGMSRMFEGRALAPNEFVNESTMLPASSSMKAWGFTADDSSSEKTERDSEAGDDGSEPDG